MSDRAASFVARLEVVERRLEAHAARPVPSAQTDPDPATGERWTAGQVWGHLAEILPYWTTQIRLVQGGAPGELKGFGRVPSDPGRLEGIERGARESADVLMDRVRAATLDLGEFLRSMDERGWTARGRHVTLGEKDVGSIVEDYMIGHLESHADQLDGLSAEGSISA